MYTVIIPSIGRITFLNQLLESIYNQTLSPKEIIILFDDNNNCKQGAKLVNKKEICQLIFCDKLNLSQKRNYGSFLSKSNNLIFSDDDDIWEHNKGELTVEALKNSQVVCHEYSKFGAYYQNPKFTIGGEKKFIPLIYILFASNIFGGGSAIASLKEIVLAIPFNEEYEYCEDYDWWIKILLAEIKIQYIPISLTKYRVHSQNMTSNYSKIIQYNLKIFNKMIYKSILLFSTSIIGFLRSFSNFLIKSIRICSLRIIKKSKKDIFF